MGNLSYRDLYYRWESEQWATGAIDLSGDKRQWDEELSTEAQHRFGSALTPSRLLAESVTQNLVPFVDAAPTEEHQVFLATQLVDGARHAVFYELFDREVWGEEGTEMTARLGWFDDVNPAFRTLAVEMLPAAADRIRRDPADLGAFIEGVVLYHLIIVGRVSLPGQHLLLDWTREAALMPGFTQGLTAIARDGSRHVAFGQRFLEEATERDGRWTDVIDKKLEELTPIALEAIQFATA